MSGAVCLAAKAALRGGAGLVRAAVPEGILPIVAGYEPSYLTAALPDDSEGRICAAARPLLSDLAAANDVLALGPGLGRSRDLDELVAELYRECERPMVVDADGLNALSEQRDRLVAAAPRILTPHAGEFARLTDSSPAAIRSDREAMAGQFADSHHVILVLKGHATLVTDGGRQFVNPTGNPGMATGGSGDVLTGLIAALLGQKLPPFEAAALGVYLHGLGGDLAAEAMSETALIASDLLDALPRAIRNYASEPGVPATG